MSWPIFFSVQTELAEQIMGGVGTEIYWAEVERIRHKPTQSLTAHDLFMKAIHHYVKFTRAGHERARQLLEEALALDPEYASAYAVLSGISINSYLQLWRLDPGLLDQAVEQADRALAIDSNDAHALAHKALTLLVQSRVAEARAYAERAVEVDPNWDVPHTLLASARILSGDPLGALRSMRRALRRNPKLPSADLQAIADINLLAGRVEVAQEMYERIRASNSDLIIPRLLLVEMYESQGRHREAQILVQEVLRVNPELTVDLVLSSGPIAAFIEAGQKGELRERLRSAGFP